MKYFGSGCFTGPGSKTEDIAFGAMMHNVEPQQIIYELNEAIKNGAEGSEQPFYRDSFCCLLIQ